MTSDRPTPSKGNLMIVDDMPVNLRLLSELLSRNGYRVRSVRTGQTALTAIEAQPPDLILLDVMMPEMDGYEVCDRLKTDDRLRHIPVIFLSALDDVSGKVKAFQVGGADYITKPFQVEEVLARVEHQMTIQRLQQELIEKNQALGELNQNLEQLVRRKTQLLIDQEKTALIGRLTQGMVHNIGNPLQAVLFCCELINKELEAPACNRKALMEYIQDAKAAIKQVQQIADNLLVKSARDRDMQLKPIQINELIQNELKLLSANLHLKHRVKQYIFLEEQLPPIPAVYTHLSQVFHNLVDNALDAMWGCQVQELTITTRQDEANLYLDIQDTGTGIAPAELPHIFDPFYTSKPLKSAERDEEEPTGTGLGLYTCVELLKPFQGRIIVTSEVNKGSTFTVALPKANEALKGTG